MSDNRVITFGCRLNAFESEVVRRAAAAAGLSDAVIVNTCAVTAEAERQARQAIRRARREHPEARIIVTGCAAELAPERYRALPEVDAVIGNRAKLVADSYRFDSQSRRPALSSTPLPTAGGQGSPRNPRISGRLSGGRGASADAGLHPLTPTLSPKGAKEKEEKGATEIEGRARAYLQVQQGCDHRCTFCIIPYARGPSRSLPIETIVEEARRLVAVGWREIVLTGVDLTAYGADLPGGPSLGEMVRRLLAAVPELARLRLSSLDPAEIDEDLWRLFGEERRLMPHLHLSLQSGDDVILKRMKRRHSRADAVAVARRARALRPEVALGADLIAGFPTESAEMFERSLALIAECGLAFVHVFPYSPRPGTPAARMPPVSRAAVRERAARLRAAGQAALAADLARRVGGVSEVLIERPGVGRSEFYAAVEFASVAAPGTVRRMRLVESRAESLIGVPL